MSAFHTRLRAMREQVREGWCTRPVLNVGDVQVVPRPANTLGRLRIMMPYCIQIRIPTVRSMGIAHEDSFVPRKCTTGVARSRPPGFCFTPGPDRETAEFVEKFKRKMKSSLVEK